MLLQGVWLKYDGNHRRVMAAGLVCNFYYTFARFLVTTHSFQKTLFDYIQYPYTTY